MKNYIKQAGLFLVCGAAITIIGLIILTLFLLLPFYSAVCYTKEEGWSIDKW